MITFHWTGSNFTGGGNDMLNSTRSLGAVTTFVVPQPDNKKRNKPKNTILIDGDILYLFRF